MEDFKALNINENIVEGLEKQGIVCPTFVQEKIYAPMLEGKDVIAVSKTGSGKTLAYLVPIFMRIDTSLRSAQAIIIAPTHELASQIHKQAQLLSENSGMDIRSALIIGSAGMPRQIEKLKEKPHIIIGSAGRIHDLIKRRKIAAHTVKTIVVDEADRMLDDQNIEALKAVIKTTLKDRNIVMASASFGKKALERAKELAPEAVEIKEETAGKMPESIKNCYIIADKRKRVEEIRKIIHGEKAKKALVFIDDPDEVETICMKLNYHGIKAAGIYGLAGKEERKNAVNSFKEGRSQVLVATDIGARGLDIPDVTHVINLDISEEPVYYLHRAGRCGRQGKEGTVISIISARQMKWIHLYEKTFGIKFEQKEMSYGKLKDVEDIKKNSVKKITSKEKKAPVENKKTTKAGKKFSAGVKKDKGHK